MNTPRRPNRFLDWGARLVTAGILAQTLFFKFTGAPEAIHIFETLGAEPWGRIGSGLVELVAVALLLAPRTPALGALLAGGVLLGAVGSHLTKLGIEVMGDGGMLFGLALVALTGAGITVLLHRRELPWIGARLSNS